ncbi:hypothetical protein AMS68_003078 [Peltaster fructicola]|uniref:Uncharacterized protein n=1 Tax=Peltaster fructicola TaxID=286661 RepID=A0A6H0XSC6_9PEZI|nr:hypothetical protein AMS68_003078 [Peltaster fructicola]
MALWAASTDRTTTTTITNAEIALEEEGDDDEASNISEKFSAIPAQSRMRRPLSVRLPASKTTQAQAPIRPGTRESDHSTVNGSATSSLALVRPISEAGQARHSAVNRVAETTQMNMAQRAGSTRKPHARSGSTVSASTRPATRPQDATPVSPTKHLERQSTKVEPSSKPMSNTYQQHLSTAKTTAPKPAIPASKAAVIPTVEEVSQEIARQQIELLQLSLMHEKTCAEIFHLEQDAQATLRDEHQRLRRSLGQIIGQELERERQTNLVAMSLWQSDQSYLMDRLRALQSIHHEVISMIQEGNTFVTTVSSFRVWAAHAEKHVRGERPGFVSGLSEDWRHAHASAALRIRSLQRELATLPAASRPSSVYTLMTACEALLDGMLRELDLMSQIEREFLRQDKGRIDSAVASLPHITEETTTQWLPRWQKLP